MKIIKISLITLAAMVAGCAYAMPGDGTYFGVTGGYSWARTSSNDVLIKNKNKGFAFGGFIGQELTDNIAVELGANKYADLKYNIPGDSPTSTLTDRFYDADLLLVNRLSITDSLSAYIKFGGSYVWERPSASLAGSETIDTAKDTFVRPEAVLGAQFKFTDNLAVNAYYSRIFGVHSLGEDHYLPDLDMAGLSLAYYL